MRIIYLLVGIVVFCCCENRVTPDVKVDAKPKIDPDYSNVVFPANIAAPNFSIQEEGEEYAVEIGGTAGTPIILKSERPTIEIPLSAWRKFLKQEQGNVFFIRITVRKDNKWTQYADIKNVISRDSIDGYLVYRLLYPGYVLWNEMGIYQRDLSSYEQVPVLENKSIHNGCLNCHNFSANSGETMMLHLRGKNAGTLIMKNGEVKKVNMKPGEYWNGGAYSAWHPAGRYLAFSANDISQSFHASGSKPVEVYDMESDMLVYDSEKDVVFTDSTLFGEKYMETFPNWSPDGKYLYFCRSKGVDRQTPLDSIYYDLYRISFDAETETFGTPECLVQASDSLKSISFPKASPDNRYLIYTLSNYGNFSIWHPESELYLLDLATGQTRNLSEVNSDNVESYHSWSSNGKWFVFSSKRRDGLWTRPYMAWFDPGNGRAGKPFLLPQKEADFYEHFTKTFNLPELIKGPVNSRLLFEHTQDDAKKLPLRK